MKSGTPAAVDRDGGPRRSGAAAALPLALVCIVSLASVSCYFSAFDLFAESSAVTDRVKDTGTKALATLPGTLATALEASFLVVGDPHFGASWAAGDDVLNSFKTLAAGTDSFSKPYAFVLSVGDDADGGTESQFKSFADWADSVYAAGGPQPWFSAVGNHDLYNGGWTHFRKYIGPSFYSLVVAGFSIYVIDSGQGTLGNYQIDKLKESFAADSNPKIVISHYPIYGGASVLYYYRLANPREQAELLNLFAQSNVRLVIAGHYHYLVHETVGPYDEWLVESLTVKDGGKTHCFSITLEKGGAATLKRLAF